MAGDINELIRLEAELKISRECETSPVSLDAKVNILKYLQVETVRQFQREYDGLYYELNKMGKLDCLRSIAPVRSTDLLQPKVVDLQDCSEDEAFENQLQFYLADAELAKPHLDELVTRVAHDTSKYEVQYADVKSRESTREKATRFCDGNVRKVADMARVTVICATPEALKEAYVGIMGLPEQHVLRVKNGFDSDWMPSGYRDVKLNPVVNEHLCEIQLHLREFFALKGGQHAVYEWARKLNVSTEMRAEDLFQNLSPEVIKEMMRLAGENWRGTGYCLPDLQVAAGKYDLAEMSHRQHLRDAEHYAREFQDHDSKESRRALLGVNTARARLAHILVEQGKFEEVEPLYVRCLANYEKVCGPDHPEVATGLSNWAGLLSRQDGNDDEAEPHYEQSQSTLEKALGQEHPDVAQLPNGQGKFEEAEPLYVRSLAIGEKALGPAHPNVAATINNRAGLLDSQGKYEEAEPLYLRSLAIREKAYGPHHTEVAASLNNLAGLLRTQGKYAEAGSLYERSQTIREKALGPEHPDVATTLNNRGELLRDQGKYEEADALFIRSLAIDEKVYGPDHPKVATTVNNRAGLLRGQGKYDEAEALYVRSLAIREKVYGPDHPAVAASLNNLAALLEIQGKYVEADPLYVRSLAIDEKIYGPDHPNVATTINNRAGLLECQVKPAEFCTPQQIIRSKAPGLEHPDVAHVTTMNLAFPITFQGNYEEAGPLYLRSLAIYEKMYGSDHPAVAASLSNLAGSLRTQGKYAEAESLYERSQAIKEKALGPEHADVATIINNRAGLLRAQGKYEEAQPLYIRSLAIDEKVYGADHPKVATDLNNWAGLMESQGKYDEAEPLYRRSLAIREKVYGPDHPAVATSLSNWAELMRSQGKYEEAEPLFVRSLAIFEKVYGTGHPDVATVLNNWAGLLAGRGKYAEAESLCTRSLAIREKVYGPDHPEVATGLNNWAGLLYRERKYPIAEPLYAQCQAVFERGLDSDPPKYGDSTDPSGGGSLSHSNPLFGLHVEYAEADPFYERSKSLREKVMGPQMKYPPVITAGFRALEHPHAAATQSVWVLLYVPGQSLNPPHLLADASYLRTDVSCSTFHLKRPQEKFTEAISLFERALAIHTKTLGDNHPQTVVTRNNLEIARQK
ncbi:unnamed protein product, partial [Ectocarpus fasciculatus]